MMKTKKILIGYLIASFSWLSLSLLIAAYFHGFSGISILNIFISILLLLYSINLLRNKSTLKTEVNKRRLTLIMLLMFCAAIIEILVWYSGQSRIISEKMYDVFLVSGIGLIILTLGFMLVLKFQERLLKDS